MISLDLSKVLPTRAYERLSGFVPGLFFVFCVVLAKPQFASTLASNLDHGFNLGRFAIVGVGLFFAFAIGNGFLLLDTFFQYFFGPLYRLKLIVDRALYIWPVQQITRWLAPKPLFRGVDINHFHHKVVEAAAVGFEDWKRFQGCWHTLARRLLKVRYGIEASEIREEEWPVLFPNIGSLEPEDVRGHMMMI